MPTIRTFDACSVWKSLLGHLAAYKEKEAHMTGLKCLVVFLCDVFEQSLHTGASLYNVHQ